MFVKGVYVTVNCIAPCAPGVSEFSFQLSYSSYFACRTMSFGLSEMSRIQKVSFQTPEKDFMFVPPRYFLDGRTDLKMKICIRMQGDEQEKKTLMKRTIVVFVFFFISIFFTVGLVRNLAILDSVLVSLSFHCAIR